MIYVGDTVHVSFMDIGMSHRERYTGLAVVTAVAPFPRVKPIGWSFDRGVSWREMTEIPKEEAP